jgi:hypothetical protein
MLRSRVGEPLIAILSAIVVGWSVLVACGGGSAGRVAGPTAGCYVGASPATCNIVKLTVTTDGRYSLVLNGLVLQGTTSVTQYLLDVAPATYDITGTTEANNLSIALSSVTSSTGGVVKSGSLTNISGLTGTVSACALTYNTSGGLTQSFVARYTVVTGTSGC